MDAETAATFFIEWVYANPGLPAEEYAVKCSEFVAEAVAAEREACAALAEDVGDSGEQSDVGMGESIASRRIADAIRNR